MKWPPDATKRERDKLGLFGEDKNDKKLINDLFNWMEKNKADYTNTFCNLMDINSDEIYKNNDFINWKNEWKKSSEGKKLSPTSNW